ncbi:L-fuculokinase [Pasteurellaceae bacterium TAE3-ERU1]|nr:L-fuculokinase [Pasteurellaceae bacterium TAE3-ERU1]
MSNVLILDCGATNIRAIAVNEYGHIIASHHILNVAHNDANNKNYYIWDFEEILNKLLECGARVIKILTEKSLESPIAIGVTTFGVDGAPFDKNKQQISPIISWKCPRTKPVMKYMSDWIDVEELYRLNGVGQYSFNTLFKLRWMQENLSDVYEKMDKFIFISSMITHRLTGQMTTDRTMAGTSMLTNLMTGNWESSVLDKLALSKDQFPPMINAGEIIGYTTQDINSLLSLSKSIPVISCGHDTQFAILGSGAKLNQPVLSSGTWEILMVRTESAIPDYSLIRQGLTTEFDSIPGLYNPAVQWLGSGILEWLTKLLYSDILGSHDFYDFIIKDAKGSTPGSQGILFNGDFCSSHGAIKGLSTVHSRGEIYRAALEFLSKNLKTGLMTLEKVGNFRANKILCVGGGSKNSLWNQIRADILNLPIDISNVAESTVLGAAMTVFYGSGNFSSLSEAQDVMSPKQITIKPSKNVEFYQDWLTQ